jgi:hypothetical protein
MDEYQTRWSPAGERFIGMFSSPSTPSSSPTEPSYVAGDELHEDDFLFSSPDAAVPQPDGPRSPGRGAPQGHLGLLAALVEIRPREDLVATVNLRPRRFGRVPLAGAASGGRRRPTVGAGARRAVEGGATRVRATRVGLPTSPTTSTSTPWHGSPPLL